MLEISALTSCYGRIPALQSIHLRIAAGELVALVGANGAGKSTLLRALSGVQPIEDGSVVFQGVDITHASPRQRVRLGVVQVPEGRQVFAPLSVEDNLRLGGYTQAARDSDAMLQTVYSMFPLLAERKQHPAGLLSGGQQQMLALGRALMGRPRLLLLDEPSMGLAPRIVADIFAAIRVLKARGTTIFLVDQNAQAALAIADRGYVLETGRIVLSGSSTELLNDEGMRRAYLGM